MFKFVATRVARPSLLLNIVPLTLINTTGEHLPWSFGVFGHMMWCTLAVSLDVLKGRVRDTT